MSRELILLSPYRLPTQHTLMLNADDVACFLNGCLALWHPEAVRGAASPPKIASPYDHEQPSAEHIYAVPESPPLFLPDDWEQRVVNVGAKFFRATSNRDETLSNLLQALNAEPGDQAKAALFSAVGFGHVMLDALFEAMDHLPQLAVNEFWQDVTSAVQASEIEVRQHLQAAAARLREARDVLYPTHIYLVDLGMWHRRDACGTDLRELLRAGTPLSLVIAAEQLEKLARADPSLIEQLREQMRAELLEVCSGPYREREDALLPVESQLWNLRKGLETYQAVLGQDLKVFARRRFGHSPQLPQFLNALGISKAILLPFDDGVLPQYRVVVVEWPAQDGKRVEAFTRTPHAADSPLTYFHLAHHLSRTILHDPTACLALLHKDKPAAPWHGDWLELSRLAPVFGEWVTLSRLFTDVMAGEYPPVSSADDFHSDHLEELTNQHADRPVSRFSEWTRLRRRLDVVGTLAGLYSGLVKCAGSLFAEQLFALEAAFELGEGEPLPILQQLEQTVAGALSERLLGRAPGDTPGYLLLNPCSFPRQVGVELDAISTPLPAPARATQIDGDKARVVVEIPALGFAWVPCHVAPGTRVPIPRTKLADEQTLRNEFFEAEIDGTTGGLRVFRTVRGRGNRIGQQLVYGPGSRMLAQSVKITSSGPALGEIISEGTLVDEHGESLATFRQRFRLWWARPLLELHIEVHPKEPPTGYPWHAHYAARFAWRDETEPLFRGVNMMSYPTSHTRPETADFFEIRSGSERTTVFTGGMPFHQRHGQRMLDVILLPEGETARTFELALGLDGDDPSQAALDFITPVTVLPSSKGPPHIGASGWLFHIDASNVALTSLRPAPDGADALIARLLECRGVSTHAQLRCVRNALHAELLDERDLVLREAPVSGDAVSLEFAAGEMLRVRILFSEKESTSQATASEHSLP